MIEEGCVKTDRPQPTGRDLLEKRSSKFKKAYLREYEINIKVLATGAIVNVGCRSIGFSTISQMINALNDYFENPEEEIRKWNDKFNSEE